MPLVSIGIPFHNPGGLLEGAIRSIQSQTLKDWELLLVNDGSTDGSIDIAQRFAEIDARIRFFNDGEKRGLVDRLNQIADLACCKMLARMDADDLMHPQRLQVQSDFLNSHTSIDLVDTGTIIIDNRRVPWASSGLNTPPGLR
jgi:glycosyltransferase involved in cell wall biosynthesis